MKIYMQPSHRQNYDESLPYESIWIPHDTPEWYFDDDTEGKENIRNVSPWVCFPGEKDEYIRIKYEELETYNYFEVSSLEELYMALKQSIAKDCNGDDEFMSSHQIWYELGYLWAGYQPE